MAKKKKWLNIIKPRLILRIPLVKLAEKTSLWFRVSVPGSLKSMTAGVFVKTDLRKKKSGKKNAGSTSANRRARLEAKGSSSTKK